VKLSMASTEDEKFARLHPVQQLRERDADHAALATGAWLKDADNRYRMLVEQSPDAILVVCDGRYVYANPAALRLFGAKAPEELLGRDPASLIHPDDRALAVERMRRVHDARETVPLRQFRVLRLDGAAVEIEGGPQPFTYQGRPAAHVVMRDITERERAAAEIRENQERYRRLVELSPDVIFILERGRVAMINEAGLRLFGARTEAEMIGRGVFELVHPDDHPVAAERLAHLESGASVPRIEQRYLRLDGTAIAVEVAAAPINWRGEQVIQVVARDVSARKDAETQLRRLGRMYAALSATNEAILRAASPEALYARVCEIAIEHGGLRVAALRLLSADGAELLPVAVSGSGADSLAGRAVSVGADTPGGETAAAIAVRTGTTQVVNDITRRAPLAAWHRPALAAGALSTASIPVRRGGRIVGLLSLFAGEVEFFDDELVRLAERMAQNVSFALDNFDRGDERRRAEARVARLGKLYAALSATNEAIARAATPAALYDRVCEVAVAEGGFASAAIVLADAATSQVTKVAASGPAAELVRAIQFSLDESVPEGRGTIGEAFRSRGPVIANDYRTDPRLAPWHAAAAPYQIASSATIPLLRGDQVAGALVLHSAEKSAFDDELVALLVRMAENLGVALENFEREAERKHALEALRRFRLALDISDDTMVLVDARTLAIVDLSAGAQRKLGFAREELLGRSILTILEGVDEEALRAAYGRLCASPDRSEVVRLGYRCKDGTSFPVETARRCVASDGKHLIVAVARDLSERLAAERQLAIHAERQEWIARFGQRALQSADLDALFAQAAQAARMTGAGAAAVFEFDPRGSQVQRAVWRLEGEAAELEVTCDDHVANAARQQLEPTVIPDQPETGRAAAARGWSRATHGSIAVQIRGEDAPFGLLMVLAQSGSGFTDDDVKFIQTVGNVLSTAVQRRQAETRLAQLAQYDSVTGLPNRNLLRDRLAQAVGQAERRRWQVAALFIDLDRFKFVNDTLGHQSGDRLLAEVGERLRASVRASDTVARFSGDEFVVVLPDLARAEDAANVAQKLLAALAAPFELNGHEAFVGASIGIALHPADCPDAESLLKAADAAMYRAKESGRGGYCFYTAEMNRRSEARLQLGADLRRAVEREEFVLVYQPKVQLATRRVCGAEALLRWCHQERGMVPPVDFIPVLEDTGLIMPVGEWVVRAACRQIRAWQEAGLEPVPVAVNVSARQFQTRDLDRRVIELVAREGVDPRLLEIELTESYLVQDPEHAIGLLRRLREAGFAISIDDFGTGYSSLAYLTRFPVSALKVDRQFVRGATAGGSDAAIVRAVIDMAHNLGFVVVAEGVETDAQVEFLRRHGCDQAQGYRFSKPIPPDEVARMLQRR